MNHFLQSSKPIENRVRTRSMTSLEQREQDQLEIQKSKDSTHENGVDFLSNMPIPILHLILQCLPTTEEAVRTTILSSRWRYLGTSIPSVDIGVRDEETFNKTKFRMFVNSVLSNKTGLHLDSLRLNCAGHFDMATVRRWIQAAVKRKVKRLDLMFFSTKIKRQTGRLPLPDCLLTCESLEELRLYTYRYSMQLPETTGFWALRVLELNLIYSFDMYLVEKFLDKCPVLEKLSLIDCAILQVHPICISSPKLKTLIILFREKIIHGHDGFWCGIKVRCPELVSLEYIGRRCRLILETVDKLKKAVILPNDVWSAYPEISSELVNTGCKMLEKLSHVESLKLKVYFLQCIDVADPIPASFKNLKTLEIGTSIDYFTINALIWFIRSSPNLESLHLIIEEGALSQENWATNELEKWKILTSHLVTVEFDAFNGEKEKCDVAFCLLEHGMALQEMIFSWWNKVTYRNKSMKLMSELSEFNKASSKVKLSSILMDIYY